MPGKPGECWKEPDKMIRIVKENLLQIEQQVLLFYSCSMARLLARSYLLRRSSVRL